jgi:hypothetical protein
MVLASRDNVFAGLVAPIYFIKKLAKILLLFNKNRIQIRHQKRLHYQSKCAK